MARKNTLDKHRRACENFRHHGQKKLAKLRAEVSRLHFSEGLSQSEIARRTGVGRNFVRRWTLCPLQDFNRDERGWPVGKRRKWDGETERRIAALHAELAADPKSFFLGATAIQQQWMLRFCEPAPPLRTIGQILKGLGLTRPHRKRQPGASRYLLYPEHTVYNVLGKRVMELDFVGQKFITGHREPLHFLGYCFKKPPRLLYYQRIAAMGSQILLDGLAEVFERFERPDCIKMDNASIMIGTGQGIGNVTGVMAFLLERQITPVFAVPRRPFTQAAIEGNNSVFGRHFWNRCRFESEDDVDRQLAWFNESSFRYTGYKAPAGPPRDKPFEPAIYFLRQVRQDPDSGRATINVLNAEVELSQAYTNYFVLAKWHLPTEEVSVYLERDKTLEQIGSHKLAVNRISARRLRKAGRLLDCIAPLKRKRQAIEKKT